MEIYIVKKSSGDYDDHSSWVDKVFAQKDTADKYVEIFNTKLARLKKLVDDLVPKDEDGDDDLFSSPSWERLYRIRQLGNAWVDIHELILKQPPTGLE